MLEDPIFLDRQHGLTHDEKGRPEVSTVGQFQHNVQMVLPSRKNNSKRKRKKGVASWTAAMCHDPFVQGRCREQARPAEQVRNHCHGPVSTPHAGLHCPCFFSFFLFVRSLSFTVASPCPTQRSLPCPCPSFRSPSPIANLLAPWQCQALQTIVSLFPRRGRSLALSCHAELSVTACFNFL